MVTISPSSTFHSFIIVGNSVTLSVVGTGYSTILAHSISTMCSLLHTLSKTSFLFANSLLIIVFQLNLTPLAFL
jgi:hypothetical protein